MDFDIDKLEESASTVFNVDVGRRSDGAPVGFIVLGTNSPQYAEIDRKLQIKNVMQAALRGNADFDMKSEEGATLVIDGTNQRRDAIIAACVTGWYGFKSGEADAEFSKDSLAKVLKHKSSWSKKLIEAIDNEGNFAQG